MSKDSNLVKVGSLLVKNPNLKAADIVKHVGVSKVYAYNLLSTARKKMRMEKMPRGGWRLKSRMQSIQNYETVAVVTTDKPVTQESNSPRIVEAHYPTEDVVNHPAHYKVGGIETIDFIEAKGLGYNLGNVIKYVTRAEHKGNLREDLLKARWYIERELRKTVK
jgi:hypothetical protein